MRLSDPGYRGQARTVREYVVESIVEPGAHVVSGYPDRVMPQWYGQRLSAGAVDKIAAHLERLTDPALLHSRPSRMTNDERKVAGEESTIFGKGFVIAPRP
jgi:hypothetical protein